MSAKLQAVENILQRDSQKLRSFVLSIIHSPSDAEDIFQNGIVRCIEKAAELKEPSKARSWIMSVLRNLAFDYLRENQKKSLLFASTEPSELEVIRDPKETAVESSICGCANELLEKLPKKYSQLLNEVEIEGESVKKLAKELGHTPNGVSVQLHRAKKLLKSALKEKCQVETYEGCLECNC